MNVGLCVNDTRLEVSVDFAEQAEAKVSLGGRGEAAGGGGEGGGRRAGGGGRGVLVLFIAVVVSP